MLFFVDHIHTYILTYTHMYMYTHTYICIYEYICVYVERESIMFCGPDYKCVS